MDDHVVLESHFTSSSRATTTPRGKRGIPSTNSTFIPHWGSLRRIHSTDPPRPRSSSSASDDGSIGSELPSASLSFYYTIPIVIGAPNPSATPHTNPSLELQMHELNFERQEYEFISRLFSILDTESRGVIGQGPIREFVKLRCPVFRRRDNAIADYRRTERNDPVASDSVRDSLTFDEVWNEVVSCSAPPGSRFVATPMSDVNIGIEGWMVFCRFIALAQYQEAKRRFSARHLQQTMRPRSGGRGSEVVLVNVPPPDPPAPLTAIELAYYERQCKAPIALPELDLDHCLVSAHDTSMASPDKKPVAGRVEISVFGPERSTTMFSPSHSSPSSVHDRDIEFILTFTVDESSVIVRRTFTDLKWLNDTFTSHKSLGGTLCGRILPPFPKRVGSTSSSDYDKGMHSGGVVVESGKVAMAAATAGVGMIKSVAKSFWGSSGSSKKEKKSRVSSGESKLTKLGKGIGNTLRQPRGSDRTGDRTASKARQLERYLNYLLEHPALSTSFPLNTVLRASQSGLDSAKRVLESSAHLHGRQKQLENMAESERGKASSYLSSLLTVSGLSSATQPNLSWVRTAAQAAIALKLHGVLETTGMPSASAKLQHASLPNFKKQSQGDEDIGDSPRPDSCAKSTPERGVDDADEDEQSFENGVVSVESALHKDSDPSGENDGYDMLPSPLPLKERSVLCAGSKNDGRSGAAIASDTMAAPHCGDKMDAATSPPADEPRFHYGSRRIGHCLGADESSTVLGDMSVDNDIDRLREVIGSVDNTLGRCLAASALISEKQRKRDAFHRNIVRGLDGWGGLRGEIISQRALLNGLTTLEKGIETSEKSLLASTDDLSWQTSLASAAVSAAEDVRCAVRAARTATGAKIAAEAAAETAQRVCNEDDFSTANEARAAQTRASIAQSHAIHATVIEHEALAAKRRAAMALAHDVKCWNVHRKRELLRMCRAIASSQRQACQQSGEAWMHLRKGLIDSSFVSVTDENREANALEKSEPEFVTQVGAVVTSAGDKGEAGTGDLAVFGEEGSVEPCTQIRPPLLRESGPKDLAVVGEKGALGGSVSSAVESDVVDALSQPAIADSFGQSALAPSTAASQSSEEVSALVINPPECAADESHTSALRPPPQPITEELGQTLDESCETAQQILAPVESPGLDGGSSGLYSQGAEFEVGVGGFSSENTRVGKDTMTESMQSLVDGLMNWGGQYDSSQDLSLPSGMAVSIALEDGEAKTGGGD